MPGDLRAEVEALATLWEEDAKAPRLGYCAKQDGRTKAACAKALRELLARSPSSPEPETGTTIVWAETQPDSYRGLCTSCGDTFGGIRAGWKPVIERAHREFCQPPAAPAPRPPEVRGLALDVSPEWVARPVHTSTSGVGAPAPRPEETRQHNPQHEEG
jgi:hypothetical protein